MATYSGPAKLKQAQREISAAVAYSSEEYPGFESWQGTYSTDEDSPVLASGVATLELTDGRRGEVHLWPAGAASGRGLFHGKF